MASSLAMKPDNAGGGLPGRRQGEKDAPSFMAPTRSSARRATTDSLASPDSRKPEAPMMNRSRSTLSPLSPRQKSRAPSPQKATVSTTPGVKRSATVSGRNSSPKEPLRKQKSGPPTAAVPLVNTRRDAGEVMQAQPSRIPRAPGMGEVVQKPYHDSPISSPTIGTAVDAGFAPVGQQKVQKLQDTISSLKGELAVKEEEVTMVRDAMVDLQAELQARATQEQELRLQVKQLEQALVQLRDQVPPDAPQEEMRAMLEVRTAELECMSEERAQLQSDLSRSEGNERRLQEQLQQLQQSHEQAVNNAATQMQGSQIEELEMKLAEKTMREAELMQELEQLRLKLAAGKKPLSQQRSLSGGRRAKAEEAQRQGDVVVPAVVVPQAAAVPGAGDGPAGGAWPFPWEHMRLKLTEQEAHIKDQSGSLGKLKEKLHQLGCAAPSGAEELSPEVRSARSAAELTSERSRRRKLEDRLNTLQAELESQSSMAAHWQRRFDLASERLSKREEFLEKVAEAQRESRARVVRKLEQQTEELRSQLEEKSVELERLQAVLEQAQADLQVAQEATAEAERSAASQERVQELEAKVEELEEEVAALQVALDEAAQECDYWKALAEEQGTMPQDEPENATQQLLQVAIRDRSQFERMLVDVQGQLARIEEELIEEEADAQQAGLQDEYDVDAGDVDPDAQAGLDRREDWLEEDEDDWNANGDDAAQHPDPMLAQLTDDGGEDEDQGDNTDDNHVSDKALGRHIHSGTDTRNDADDEGATQQAGSRRKSDAALTADDEQLAIHTRQECETAEERGPDEVQEIEVQSIEADIMAASSLECSEEVIGAPVPTDGSKSAHPVEASHSEPAPGQEVSAADAVDGESDDWDPFDDLSDPEGEPETAPAGDNFDELSDPGDGDVLLAESSLVGGSDVAKAEEQEVVSWLTNDSSMPRRGEPGISMRTMADAMHAQGGRRPTDEARSWSRVPTFGEEPRVPEKGRVSGTTMNPLFKE